MSENVKQSWHSLLTEVGLQIVVIVTLIFYMKIESWFLTTVRAEDVARGLFGMLFLVESIALIWCWNSAIRNGRNPLVLLVFAACLMLMTAVQLIYATVLFLT